MSQAKQLLRLAGKAVEQNRLVKQCGESHDWEDREPIFPGDPHPLDIECRKCHLLSSKKGDTK